MKVAETLTRNEETVEKELTMPSYAYIALRDSASDSVKPLTQSKIFYEIVHISTETDCEDSLNRLERTVDGQLTKLLGEQIVKLLEEITITDWSRQSLFNAVPHDVEPTTKKDGVRIRLPNETWVQIGRQRYIGDWFTPLLEEFAASAYTARTNRIEVKQQVAEYLDEGVEPSHDIARAVCLSGNSERFDGVDDAHLYLQQAMASEWDADTITVQKLRSWGTDQLRERGLHQKARGERVRALATAIRNAELEPSEQELRELVTECYGITTERTIDKYLADLPRSWKGNLELVNITDLMNQIKQSVLKSVDARENVREVAEEESLSDWYGIDEPESIETYFEDDDALEAALWEWFETDIPPLLIGNTPYGSKARKKLEKQLNIVVIDGFAPMYEDCRVIDHRAE